MGEFTINRMTAQWHGQSQTTHLTWGTLDTLSCINGTSEGPQGISVNNYAKAGVLLGSMPALYLISFYLKVGLPNLCCKNPHDHAVTEKERIFCISLVPFHCDLNFHSAGYERKWKYILNLLLLNIFIFPKKPIFKLKTNLYSKSAN